MPACRCWLVDHRLAADAGSLMISKLASRQAQIHERAGLSVHIKASFWPYMVPRDTERRRKQAGSVHACMRVPIEGATSGHFRPPPPGFAGVSCSSSQLGKTAAQVHTCMETQTSEKNHVSNRPFFEPPRKPHARFTGRCRISHGVSFRTKERISVDTSAGILWYA